MSESTALTANRKTRRVSIIEQLKAGPYQPSGGWDDPQRVTNCKLVINAGFSGKTLPLACAAVDLLSEREPDTVRGIMYAAVSVGWLPDTGDRSYGKI